MDTQNHFYSHAGVLARHCGLRRPRHLAGLLQHGWTATSPVAANFGDFPHVDGRGRRRLLVWSHGSRAWSPEREPALTEAIGAPWLYLAQLVGRGPVGPSGADERPTLVVPLHGTRVIRRPGDHAALAAEVREREGAAVVSVHHEDLHDLDLVRGWRSGGHDLVSFGARTDPAFLPRQLGLMLGVGRVVSNRLSTAVLYAAALGIPVAVYGDPFTTQRDEHAAYERLVEVWPEFHGERPDPEVTTALARRELGADHVRGPEELRDLLGWRRPVSPGPALDYWTRGPVEKAVRVLGLRQRVESAQRLETGVGAGAWLRHPLSHLPQPLSRRLPPVDPLPTPLRTEV